MKYLINILLSFFCCLVFNSCENEIELNIPVSNPKIVIHGVISPESKIILDVRKSISVLERDHVDWSNQQIENADFKLFKNMQFIGDLSVDSTNKLIYNINDTNIKEGDNFVLTGNALNYPSINTTVSIPNKPDISISDFIYSKNDNYSYNTSFTVNIIDNPTQEDYYTIALQVRLNSIAGNDFIEDEIFKQNDPSFKLIYRTYFLNDKLFNGNTKTINIQYMDYAQLSSIHPTDTFWIECKTLSKDYYNYLITTNKQSINEKDFYAEPVYVTNNIEGGYGILGAYNYKRIPLVLHYNGK
jgi:hypothetical protein